MTAADKEEFKKQNPERWDFKLTPIKA